MIYYFSLNGLKPVPIDKDENKKSEEIDSLRFFIQIIFILKTINIQDFVKGHSMRQALLEESGKSFCKVEKPVLQFREDQTYRI